MKGMATLFMFTAGMLWGVALMFEEPRFSKPILIIAGALFLALSLGLLVDRSRRYRQN